MKKLSLVILILILIFIAFLLYNAFNFTSNQTQIDAVERVSISEGAVDRYAEAISIRTVSFEDNADFDSLQFEKFNVFLEKSYPLIYDRLNHTIFSEYSHLYHWKGNDPSLEPIILMAHLDVVPIASPSAWSVHPFTAGVVNDTIYGRGAMDCKFGVITIMESAEQLLSEGFTPDRDIYISLGHDEEVMGEQGAVKIANYLKDKGVQAHFVLDEGLVIADGLIPNIETPVALIGIAEKGFLSVDLSVAMAGGHSSSPAKETSIDVLSKAISKLKENPCPKALNPVVNAFLDRLGPEMDFFPKLAIANRWLLKSFILKDYEKSNNGNAIIRTTTSPTIFEAGIKENVIPTVARAVVNFRIIPGETIDDVMTHVKQVIDDERVIIEMHSKGSNPSPISSYKNVPFKHIEQSIKQVFPKMIVVPSLVLGATDSRHFNIISDNIYRFSPYVVNDENLTCFHGIDERVPKIEFENGIRFYRQIILNNTNK